MQNLGWTTVTFPQPNPTSALQTEQGVEGAPGSHPLQNAYEELFAASQEFFNLPDNEKEKWKHRLGSEEGWSKIPGEKEFITLRTLSYTPDILKVPAKRYWDLMASYLSTCLGRIGASVGLEDGEDEGFRRYVGPCKVMGQAEEEKTSTMLRLFRYEGWDEKVVAEPHADLGLLSCVVGDVPGLEVWDGRNWFDVERRYGRPCATLLAGRQLERLSNRRYAAGGHRVVSYGRSSQSSEKRYRYSIVFVLRAHEEIVVDTDILTTPITGEFLGGDRKKGVLGKDWYAEIRGAHFNINTGVEERDKQKRKIEARKKNAALGSG